MSTEPKTEPGDWLKLAYTTAELGETITKAEVRSVITVVLPYIEKQIEREIRAKLDAELEAEMKRGFPQPVTAGLMKAQAIVRGGE